MIDESNNPEDRKRLLIETALQKAMQLTPSVDGDETRQVPLADTDQAKGVLSRCPSCFADIETDSIIDSTAIECSSCDTTYYFADSGTQVRVPNQIASFRLTKRLGTGAFGQVWLAEDEKLDRQVAIKFPRVIDSSAEFRALFLREARNAGQLRHPNIVNIHEVGQQDDFVYIVSEYVDSIPLDQWVRKHRPSFQESVRICVIVARALSAAHARGIVHRDLKPSNILIDKQGQPYITDFGLSKREAETNTIDKQGRVLGTPAYMSPEQAAGKSNESDARSDVYSLGVILFELLTGEKPFRGESRMLIQNVISEPPPHPRNLNANIPKDLETICLKCLNKNPASRYQTTELLADDLIRWSENKPVRARPAGKLESSVRWCQRNTVLAVLMAAVVLALLAGLAGVSWQWQKTRRALAAVQTQTDRGDQLLNEAEQIVDEFLTEISAHEAMLADKPGMEQLRLKLLSRARSYYRMFIDREGSEASRTRLVRALAGSGIVNNELKDFDQAIVDCTAGIEMANQLIDSNIDILENQHNLIRLEVGLGRAFFKERDLSSAESSLRQSCKLCQRLLDDDSESAFVIAWYGQSLNYLGRIARIRQQPENSARLSREASQVLDRLLAQKHVSQMDRNNVADAKLDMAIEFGSSNPHEGIRLSNEALQILELTPENESQAVNLIAEKSTRWSVTVASALAMKTRLSRLTGEWDRTSELQEQTLKFFEEARRFFPKHYELAQGQATLFIWIGRDAHSRLDSDTAFQFFEKAEAILSKLEQRFSEEFDVKVRLGELNESLAEVYFYSGQEQRGIESLQSALDIRQELIELYPETMDLRFSKVRSHLALGNLQVQYEMLDEAEQQYETAKSLIDSLVEDGFPVSRTMRAMGFVYRGLSRVFGERKITDKAVHFAERSLEIRRQHSIEEPDNQRIRREYVSTIDALGVTLLNGKQYEEAIEFFRQSIEELQKDIRKMPGPELVLSIGGSHVNLAICLRRLKKFDDSLSYSERALDLLNPLIEKFPNHRLLKDFLGKANACHARTLREFADHRLSSAQSKESLVEILKDVRQACEMTDWKKKRCVATLTRAVLQSVEQGGELEQLLNGIPDKKQKQIREQVEAIKNSNNSVDNLG